MTSTRTRNGSLDLADTFDTDKRLIVTGNTATISLQAVDRETHQHVNIALGTVELDYLAAEILRIRDNLGI